MHRIFCTQLSIFVEDTFLFQRVCIWKITKEGQWSPLHGGGGRCLGGQDWTHVRTGRRPPQ